MFKFLDTHTYNMPCHFGGREGSGISVYYNDNTDITVSYETEMDALEKYVHEDFEIVSPMINISFVFCHEVDFLAGGFYNIAQALVPVRYKKTKEPIDGVYPLVVWENKTDPIIGGREQSGVPKIFCDISEYQVIGDHVFSTASYNGTDFLRIDFTKKETFTRKEVEKRNENSKVNLLGWRYIPNMGRPGAALSHATLYPQEMIMQEGWKGEGKITWNTVTWEQVPTQAHIINALASLPIKRYVSSHFGKSKIILHPRFCRALP